MVMHVELQATCSALGYQEGDKYIKEPDCLETVKDLIRFLKREDETCDIRRQLGDAQILQKDLVPILKNYQDDNSLFETVLRLMVNLTQPTVLCFQNKLPTDKILRNHALEIDAHLQTYKEAFVDEMLFAVLTEKIGDILKLDWETRQEEDKLLLERLLILLRNILHIPPNPDREQRTDDDASIHDQILWVIHVTGLEDLVLYIASSENERQLCMHLLEVVSLMFREQTPDTLACAGVQRSVSEKEKDERELEMIREKERVQKKMNLLKHSTRHSRFGGTYVISNMKSISDKDLIYHKSQADAHNFSLDTNKRPKKKPKNRQPIKDKEVTRRSTLSIRLSLKEFCVQFLENAYNPLMSAVKDTLQRERAQEHDETYYLWAMRFFMEFCRHHSKRVELVSETLSVQAFHYIYTNLVTYYEMITTEKTEAITWSKRVHLALKAYQELLQTTDMMDRSRNPQLIESAKVLKSNVFYMMEFRDIFATLLKKFDQSRQSRTYLRDLIETTHLFVKMLEAFSKRTNHLVVQKKGKKKKKKSKPKLNATETAEPTAQELEDLWDEVSGEMSAIFQGRGDIPEVAPFDASLEVEVDDQRVEAMCRIQERMRNRAPGEAVAIFRAAREVWPERGEFGTQDMAPEDEFLALREIFMAPLPKPSHSQSQSQDEPPVEDEGGEMEEYEEEVEREPDRAEQEFNFTGFLLTFCKPDILRSYGLLLADFETNTDHTNHSIIKMLHRISVDLGFPGMVFQASIFRVFQKILLGPFGCLSRFKEMVKFGAFIVRKFVETAEKNKKVFMEMLFWKGSKESHEICEGYGSVSSKDSKVQWSEDLEEELVRLFEEFRDSEEHDPENDVADLILGRLTDPTKTRTQVIRQLKHMHLIQSAKELKKKPVKKHAWREEEEFELADLYDLYKESDDPLGNILANMSNKRSKFKVTEKLISLGMVNHKSQLHKKRKRKSGKKDGYEDDGDDSDSEDERPNGFEEFGEPPSQQSSSSESEASESEKEAEGEGSRSLSVEQRLRALVEGGYRDQIAWIQRGLRRTAEDRERDDYRVAVPIVPLTEENETAMEDKSFMDFLELIGITPPANEQEAFWRIPGELTVSELTTIAEGLELGENGEPLAADEIKPVEKVKQKKEKKKRKTKKAAPAEDKDEKKKKSDEKRKAERDRKNALKALAQNRKAGNKRKRKSMVDSNSDASGSEKENMTELPPLANSAEPSKERKKKKIVKKQQLDSSDSDSDDNRLVMATDSPAPKRPKLFDSDSEDEDKSTQGESQQSTLRGRQDKLFDSDSSDDDHVEKTSKESSEVPTQDKASIESSSDEEEPISSLSKSTTQKESQEPPSSKTIESDSENNTVDRELGENNTVPTDKPLNDNSSDDEPISSLSKSTEVKKAKKKKILSDSSDSEDDATNDGKLSENMSVNDKPSLDSSSEDEPISSIVAKKKGSAKKQLDSSDSENESNAEVNSNETGLVLNGAKSIEDEDDESLSSNAKSTPRGKKKTKSASKSTPSGKKKNMKETETKSTRRGKKNLKESENKSTPRGKKNVKETESKSTPKGNKKTEEGESKSTPIGKKNMKETETKSTPRGKKNMKESESKGKKKTKEGEKQSKALEKKNLKGRQKKQMKSDSEEDARDIVQDQTDNVNGIASSDSSSDDEPISSLLTAKSKKRQRTDNKDGSPLEDVPQSKRQKVSDSEILSPLQLSMSQDSEDESEVKDSEGHVKGQSKLFQSDDSSSEDEPLMNAVRKKVQQPKTAEESFPATLLSQQDSDLDDHIPLRKAMRKNVIDSDED